MPLSELQKTSSRFNQQSQRFHLPGAYLDTYHTYDLRTLDPNNIQTSLAPGFYIRDHASYKKWVKQLKEMQSYFRDDCIFSIYDEKPAWMKDDESSEGKQEQEDEEVRQDLGPTRIKNSPPNPKRIQDPYS